MIRNKKEIYKKEIPPSKISEEETTLEDPNFRNIYKAPKTQEEMYFLLCRKKDDEVLKDYLILLDANKLGQNEIISLDTQPPRNQMALIQKKPEALKKKVGYSSSKKN